LLHAEFSIAERTRSLRGIDDAAWGTAWPRPAPLALRAIHLLLDVPVQAVPLGTSGGRPLRCTAKDVIANPPKGVWQSQGSCKAERNFPEIATSLGFGNDKSNHPPKADPSTIHYSLLPITYPIPWMSRSGNAARSVNKPFSGSKMQIPR